jgi:alpha-tubulin suppressor-like RCC1 family protein
MCRMIVGTVLLCTALCSSAEPRIVSVAAATDHTVAVDAEGRMWAWGANPWGQLGDGTTERRLTPVLVAGLDHVVAVAAGGYHSARSCSTILARGNSSAVVAVRRTCLPA